MGERKGMEVISALITLYNLFAYALIYALIYSCSCVKERKINSDFWQNWHFNVKGR